MTGSQVPARPLDEIPSGEMRVLVTNDDGVDSPALPPLVRAVTDLGPVQVVAPDGERSWSGKHLSRLARIPIATVQRDGIAMLAVGGSPADATQIGVHRGLRPDLVLSGINLGHNHGTAFLMSSGTVGAAVEAGLTGHPAIALSTGIVEGDFMTWRRHAQSAAASADWARVAQVSAAIVADVVASGLLDHCDVVSINLPWEVTHDTPRWVTTIARTGYGPVYSLAGATNGGMEQWVPSFSELRVLDEDLAGTDIGVAREGHVSITPVVLPNGAQVPAAVANRARARP